MLGILWERGGARDGAAVAVDRPICFGRCRLDPRGGLRRGKRDVRLTPKAMACSALPGAGEHNHCLHHVTSDEDRAGALGNVRRVLRDDGVYVLEIVVYHEGRDYGRDRFDARSSTKLVQIDDLDPAFDGRQFEDLIRIDDTWYWPRGRHRSPAELRVEVERAGLGVAYQSSFGGIFVCVPDAGASSIEDLRYEIDER